MISIIHPSRGRPEKSKSIIDKWLFCASVKEDLQVIVSVDEDDDYVAYSQVHGLPVYTQNLIGQNRLLIRRNRSCVDAINNGVQAAQGNIIIVVSDDTSCYALWDRHLRDTLEGKSDYLLKTDDGIQDYIVTMTVMDRKYYERDGYIYHPDFFHQFADTYLTCVADIRGRLIKSNLKFPHLHYSHIKEAPDALNKRNDDTWKEGQKTFVRLMKQFTPEERARIKDKSMQGFMKHVGL